MGKSGSRGALLTVNRDPREEDLVRSHNVQTRVVAAVITTTGLLLLA